MKCKDGQREKPREIHGEKEKSNNPSTAKSIGDRNCKMKISKRPRVGDYIQTQAMQRSGGYKVDEERWGGGCREGRRCELKRHKGMEIMGFSVKREGVSGIREGVCLKKM